jgi:hypothetical protein
MSTNNLAKFVLLKENYLNDWGGELINHNYQTRIMTRQPLFLPRNLNRYQSKTIVYILPRIWNSLPNDLKNLPSQVEINIKLKNYFKSLSHENL